MPTPEIKEAVRRGLVTVTPYYSGYKVAGATDDVFILDELNALGATFDAKSGTYKVLGDKAAALKSAATETEKVAAVKALRAEKAGKAGAAMTDAARAAEMKRASKEIKAVYQQALIEHQRELKSVLERYANAQDPVEAIKLGYRRDELESVIDGLSSGLVSAGGEAQNAVNGLLPQSKSLARNIAAWQVDNMEGLRVSRLLGNRAATVAVLNKYDRIAWNKLQSPAAAKKALRMAITRGVLTGEHPSKIAGRLSGVFNQWSGRAMTIARTETGRVMSAAQQELYAELNAAGVKLKNQWIATLDGATRHTHRRVDGEIREVGKKFSNGCVRPGEGSSAAEVVNCRCCIIPVVDGFKPNAPVRRNNITGETIPFQSYKEWEKAGRKLKDAVQPDSLSDILESYVRFGGFQTINAAANDILGAQFSPWSNGVDDRFFLERGEITEKIRANANKLMDTIRAQPKSDRELVRVNFAGTREIPKVGEQITWGVRSTSKANANEFAHAIANDAIDGLKPVADTAPPPWERGDLVTFHIQGKTAQLDISETAATEVFREQQEVLVSGRFEVSKVEKEIFETKYEIVEGYKGTTPREYAAKEGLELEYFTSKKGVDMVRFGSRTYPVDKLDVPTTALGSTEIITRPTVTIQHVYLKPIE